MKAIKLVKLTFFKFIHTNNMRLLFSFLLFTFYFTSTAQIPSYVPTNGLVAYWPFNGNLIDYGSNSYNGTSNGTVAFVLDRNSNANSAIQLGSGYVTASPNVFQFQYSSSFSLSLWFTKESATDGGRLISTECSEGNFRIAAYTTTGNYAVQYGTYLNDIVPLNTWTHLVCTYNNGDFKLFQNGILKISEIISLTQVQNFCSPFTIGAKAAPGYDRWNGKIDDLAVYSRALSTQEITQLYNSTIAPTPPQDTTSNVGIGTTTPKRKLHVNDVMRLEPRDSAPANPAKGDIYFDGVLNKIRYYNGTSWISL